MEPLEGSPRGDHAGAWHHVINRGVAKRTVFEGSRDFRLFLSLLARQVREERIEVHAFSILNTHFHLLVRSPQGQLSEAMRRVESPYARAFNATRDRDGPLFRGRFFSRLVKSESYWTNVVRYIDQNAVLAGLARTPSDYPFGSAQCYVNDAGPPWLSMGEIRERVRLSRASSRYDPADYAAVFGRGLSDHGRWILERRSTMGPKAARLHDPFERLRRGRSTEVSQWLRERALLADGTHPDLAVASPSAIEEQIGVCRRDHGAWKLDSDRRGKWTDGWSVVEVGLLRHACGLTFPEIAARRACSTSNACRVARVHRELVGTDESYASRAAAALHAVLEKMEF